MGVKKTAKKEKITYISGAESQLQPDWWNFMLHASAMQDTATTATVGLFVTAFVAALVTTGS